MSTETTEGMFKEETVLEEAQRVVSGPRQEAYGSPYDDHTRVGRMWGAILGVPDIPAHIVSMMMVAVKVSREVNEHGRDNLVDIAGYSLCADIEYAEGVRHGTT